MKSSQDRRAVHVPRVPLVTLVDICTQGDEPAPFQAESANVSGRGMHVRTSYLPEVGEALVCRLEHDDREILVEGRVAWRAEGQESGEFGIQFTALDADSADVLQSLGEAPKDSSRSRPAPEEEDDGVGEDVFAQGSRVKLHIDGLGAPMKACVHEGTHRKLRVGSCLEFLKVGRSLQVEDLAAGEQRGAHVDSVNVVINPATSIPELVVQLRYDGVSPTPAPAKVKGAAPGIDYDDDAFSSVGKRVRATEDEESDEEGHFEEDEEAPWAPAAEALRARLGGVARKAGSVAQRAGGALSILAKSASQSVATISSERSKSKNSRAPSTAHATKRRQTTRRTSQAAPPHLRSGIHDMGLAGRVRVSEPPRTSKQVPEARPKRRVPPAMIFGGAFVLFVGSALALRGASDAAPQASAEEAPKAAPQAPAPAQPIQAAPAAAPVKVAKKDAPDDSVMAEVPLFGPQAMAVKAAEAPEAEVNVAEAERRSAAAAIEDESWDEPVVETTVEDAKPWGNGKLYLPTIHRIRLDGVGADLAGAVSSDGFTVVVPGRKAMESGKAIQKRDKRIITVETSNTARGASFKFEFRGAVPPYRVRLRQDFVEFLISAPEETVARL